MHHYTGLVLRTYVPRKQKLALFDYQLGRFDGIACVKDGKILQRLSHGALLQYNAHSVQYGYELSNIELINLPLHLAAHDIYFLHHMLELYYYCIPINQLSMQLFELAMYIFDVNSFLYTHEYGKKVFLLRFFALLGMWPDGKNIMLPKIHSLISQPIEVMLMNVLDKTIVQELDALIAACIAAHPHNNKFKTLCFYNERHL